MINNQQQRRLTSISSKVDGDTVGIYFHRLNSSETRTIISVVPIAGSTIPIEEVYGEERVAALNYRWSRIRDMLNLTPRFEGARLYNIELMEEDVENCSIEVMSVGKRNVYEVYFPRTNYTLRFRYLSQIHLRRKLLLNYIQFEHPDLVKNRFWMRFTKDFDAPQAWYPIPEKCKHEGKRMSHTRTQQFKFKEWLIHNFPQLKPKFKHAYMVYTGNREEIETTHKELVGE